MNDSKTKKRLSKVMAAAGIASRRACEELIFNGKVKVNGLTVLLPQTLVSSQQDLITVNDQKIGAEESKVYYILNKPMGYVCTNRPFGSTKLVLDLFPDKTHRLFTVGRLDKNTQGLLIVTNDGHFAHRMIHPSSDIRKEYLAKSDSEITHEHLVAISNGTLVQGVFIKPIDVSKVRKGTVKVTIAEGKKHEVRILLEAAGLQITELTRIRIGGLHLGPLALGSWRTMTEREKEMIFE